MAEAAPVPADRVREVRPGEPREGKAVVYWSTMARRATVNPALQYAAGQAERLRGGLWVLEALRADHPYACHRFHRWVVDGMQDTRRALDKAGIPYHAHLERQAGSGRGLLAAAATDAGLVVTDDHPGFFIPRMLDAVAATDLGCPVHAVDGNALMPLASTPGPFTTAFSFRTYLHKHLLDHLWMPAPGTPDAEGAEVPAGVAEGWPATDLERPGIDHLPIDKGVGPVEATGGHRAARAALDRFVEQRARYEDAHHPDALATSRLSPYLHFGHMGVHEIVGAVLDAQGWHPGCMNEGARGKRRGWWGASEPVEAFLDQLVTWRTLGFVDQHHRPDNTDFHTLPGWARTTLDAHRDDEREGSYDLEDLEAAGTNDPVWNAAQRQLLEEGVIHNYLRMAWGKRILGWAPDPATALGWMFHLNDKWALDGRDPNSVSGIMWCLGRFDRAWGPERPVYGKVRYMSSENTVRKLRMDAYLNRYGGEGRTPKRPGPRSG